MSMLTVPTESAVRTMINPGRGWWNDKNLIRLAARTAFRDCNTDEFDQAVAFCKEKNLSPMSGQLFAFVFSKDDTKKRNMVIVTSIMGYRAIANRSGDYMPGAAKAFFDAGAKDPLTNPRGIVRAEASVERFIHGGWKSLTEEAFWESFAPIIKAGEDEDAYEWIETGETWPNGAAKKRKKLRAGASVVLRLDPKKDGWIRMGDVMLKKCPEAAGLRRGWPEDLSGLYVEEEIHRSQVIDAEYADLTPSEIVERADTERRIERIGGPGILACLDDTGNLERIEFGQFADRALAATEKMPPEKVAALVARNSPAFNEFWAHNKTDALALKRQLEARAGAAPKAPPLAPTEPGPGLGRSQRSDDVAANRVQLKTTLRNELSGLASMRDYLKWTASFRERAGLLSRADVSEIEREAIGVQDTLAKAEAANP